MNEEAREQLDQINVEEQTKKLQELRNLGIDPYGVPFPENIPFKTFDLIRKNFWIKMFSYGLPVE